MLKLGLNKGIDTSFGTYVGGQYISYPRWNRYLKYAFYWLPGGMDRVSRQQLVCVMPGSRPDGDGNLYTVNTPVIDADGWLNTYGSYSQLVPYSEDTSNWTGSGPWTRSINLATTGIYIVSTNLSGATVTITAGTATIDAGASATYGTPDQFEVTIAGTVTITTDIADPKAQLTKTTYAMPYAINATSGTLVILDNMPNATRELGFNFSGIPLTLNALDGTADGITLNSGNLVAVNKYLVITTEADHFGVGVVAGDRVTGLTTALNANNTVQTILDAQGELHFQWMPMFNAADVTTGTFNILSSDETTPGMLYYDADNQEIRSFDGTNTATVACVPVRGQSYNIQLGWGIIAGQQMQLICDTTVGTAVTHAGRFPVGTQLSFGWEDVHWGKSKLVLILKSFIFEGLGGLIFDNTGGVIFDDTGGVIFEDY